MARPRLPFKRLYVAAHLRIHCRHDGSYAFRRALLEQVPLVPDERRREHHRQRNDRHGGGEYDQKKVCAELHDVLAGKLYRGLPLDRAL